MFEAWSQTGDKVALKLLNTRGQPKAEQVWQQREAVLAKKMKEQQIEHPNLMVPLDVFGTGEVFCIVYDFAPLGMLSISLHFLTLQ